MQKLTGRFSARGEDGFDYSVLVFTEEGETKDERSKPTAGRRVLLTSAGLSVLRMEKGQYRLAMGGVRLTSDDPNAP
jgi:hypothetical protein